MGIEITNSKFFSHLIAPSDSTKKRAKETVYDYCIKTGERGTPSKIIIIEGSESKKLPHHEDDKAKKSAILLCLFTKQLRQVILDNYTNDPVKLSQNLEKLKGCCLLHQIYRDGDDKTKSSVDDLKRSLDSLNSLLKTGEYPYPDQIDQSCLIGQLLIDKELCIPEKIGQLDVTELQSKIDQFETELLKHINQTLCHINCNDNPLIINELKEYYHNVLSSPFSNLLSNSDVNGRTCYTIQMFIRKVNQLIEDKFNFPVPVSGPNIRVVSHVQPEAAKKSKLTTTDTKSKLTTTTTEKDDSHLLNSIVHNPNNPIIFEKLASETSFIEVKTSSPTPALVHSESIEQSVESSGNVNPFENSDTCSLDTTQHSIELETLSSVARTFDKLSDDSTLDKPANLPQGSSRQRNCLQRRNQGIDFHKHSQIKVY